ncbi:hypothetical protein [Mucilaginibacter sp. FT3.2]|uniref:hypothetical protein n=1 Tax=Mucilaginibacter sp. FT3.2 TaxID=2723090 RepID=UPI00160C01A3|nr:hypothetical protein [Mucilaginibacter sp. FT3.2]MBB6235291.1 hypothetical protein [Mucilaginibacter sp. FT3.2]
MLLITRIIIVLLLLLVLVQDLLFRAVHWIIFPLLALGLLYLKWLENPVSSFAGFSQPVIVNLGFLIMIMGLLSLYLFLRKGRLINITDGFIGWADILFQGAIAFYLSVLNYLFFYIASMPLVLLLWLLWQSVTGNKNKHIPLAGFQSILFILFLAGDWTCFQLHITGDDWVLRNVMPWIQRSR